MSYLNISEEMEIEELVAMLELLTGRKRGTLASRRFEVHSHTCGLNQWGEREGGCGYTWTHDGAETQKITDDAVYTSLHMCPMCGLGPWRTIVPE